jgi:serine O-acetyltransferase
MVRYVGPKLRPWSPRFLFAMARAAHTHPGLIAVVVYRFGQWVHFRCRIPILRQILQLYYYCWFNWVRTRLHIEVGHTATIGGGFRILHMSCLINSRVVAGEGLSINHGCLIGATETGVPVLGNHVRLTAHSMVVGGITLGDNVLVGAGAVVVHSFADGAVVAGVPARLLRYQEGLSDEGAARPPASEPAAGSSGAANSASDDY